jgi:metal-responsive CopG/Arc/MetJ family transcriptional regulator
MAERQKERVQFDFAPEALQRLDDIKQKTGAATRAETVRNALRVYEWLVDEIEDDPESTIKVVNKKDEVTSMLKAKFLLK